MILDQRKMRQQALSSIRSSCLVRVQASFRSVLAMGPGREASSTWQEVTDKHNSSRVLYREGLDGVCMCSAVQGLTDTEEDDVQPKCQAG